MDYYAHYYTALTWQIYCYNVINTVSWENMFPRSPAAPPRPPRCPDPPWAGVHRPRRSGAGSSLAGGPPPLILLRPPAPLLVVRILVLEQLVLAGGGGTGGVNLVPELVNIVRVTDNHLVQTCKLCLMMFIVNYSEFFFMESAILGYGIHDYKLNGHR